MSSSTSSSPPAEAIVVMDRFVSATSSQDAVESLQAMVDGLKATSKGGSASASGSSGSSTTNNNKNHKSGGQLLLSWNPTWILRHDDLPDHLVWLLQHSTLKGSDISCEEGVGLTCQLYQHLVHDSAALKQPQPGMLLEALLDVLDHPPPPQSSSNHHQHHPVYVRVMALKLLEEMSRRHVTVASNQWMQAPNGLHRLSDLISIDVDAQPMEEAVRNEALNVAKLLARNAAMAQIFFFAEVDVKLLDLAVHEGGLTKGSPIVVDALEIVEELLKHADAALLDLVLQRPTISQRLGRLIDLRDGYEFRNPKSIQSTSSSRKAASRGSSDDNDDEDEDDDLDNLLASGDAKQRKKGKSPSQGEQSEEMIVPRLTKSEEHVVHLVLNIVRLLLGTDDLKKAAWNQFGRLCYFIWESALVYPRQPPQCALPSPHLQQEILEVVAECIHDPNVMDTINGFDRLLALVCTGGAIAENNQERLGLSQTALAVLRKTLSSDRIHDTLMRTLAPPPIVDDDDDAAPPPDFTVVQKLWSTVLESLNAENNEQRTVLLSGALGGLSLMLIDKESREIMSKVTPLPINQMLEALYNETDEIVQLSLLRFLCEWIYDCPLIAHVLLDSPASSQLAGMATNSTKDSPLQPLVHLLLGLSMEYLTTEEECGGWTRSGILQIVNKVGIAKYTSSLESLKSKSTPSMPWMVSDSESKTWKKFCTHAVLIVRKRVVEELTGSGEPDCSDEPGDEASLELAGGTAAVRPLQKLISQQSKELDELRLELEEAQAKVALQEAQLDTWKRRIESTPTELDGMLNEFTSKTATLEETVQSLKTELVNVTAEKDAEREKLQYKIAETQRERDQFRIERQEARDDLERTEQEMRALSEAYAGLEQVYQLNQQSQNQGVGAPTGEAPSTPQQSQGEDSHQAMPGSTEVATLRAENARLQNDARAADDWMAMAVQRMNDMGAANAELERQVVTLSSQVESPRGLEEQASQHDRVAATEQTQLLEHKLAQEAALRQSIEEQLLQVQMEREQQMTELEGRAIVAEEKLDATVESLRSEQKAKAELEKSINALNLEKEQLQRQGSPSGEVDDDVANRLSNLQSEFDSYVVAKTAEIESLSVSLRQSQEVGATSEKLQLVEREAEESRQRSQQEIYRLESIVRELEARLGKNLGAYKVEDIRLRDEEIEELRKANDAAQEWMAKAVENHQVLSAQASTLSEENASLTTRLAETESKLKSSSSSESQKQALEHELLKKNQQLESVQAKLSEIESGYLQLKQEKEANQGLLDELGIAMDDVGVMKQKIAESEVAVKEMEAKLAGSTMNEENKRLREENDDYEKRLGEFQKWADTAQTKIAEMMADKEEVQKLHSLALAEATKLRKDIEELKLKEVQKPDEKMTADTAAMSLLKAEVSELQHAKEAMTMEKERQAEDYERLELQYRELEALFARNQETLEDLKSEGATLAFDLSVERDVSSARTAEVDALKAEISSLQQSLEEANQQSHKMTTDDHADVTALSNAVGVESSRIDELLDDLRRKDEEIRAANEELSKGEGIVQQWEDRVTQLEADLAHAQNQMLEQEAEAQDAIDKWQESYTASEDRRADLEEQNTALQAQLSTLQNGIDDMAPDHAGPNLALEASKISLQTAEDTLTRREEEYREKVADLETTVQSLQTQLQQEEEYAKDVVNQWQENCTAAEEECAATKLALEEMKKSKEVLESTFNQTVDQSQVRDLESQLTARNEELRTALASLESSKHDAHELQERVSVLENHLSDLEQQLEEQQARFHEVTADLRQELSVAEQEKASLQIEMETVVACKDAEMQQLREGISNDEEMTQRQEELELEIGALRERLESQEEEALKSISLLKEKISESNRRNDALQNDLEKLTRTEPTELIELRETLAKSDGIARQWEARAQELGKAVADLERQLSEQEEQAVHAIARWEANSSELEVRHSKVESELAEAYQTISTCDWTIEQLRAMKERHHVQVEEFESSLQANSSLADEISRLTKALESERQGRADEREELQVEIAEVRERYANARDEIQSIATESEAVIDQWTERCQALEESIAGFQNEKNELQHQLDEQEREANEAISIWEQKTEELENELDVAEQQLVQLRGKLLCTDANDLSLVNAVDTMQNEKIYLKAKLEEIEATVYEQTSQVALLESQMAEKDKRLNSLQKSSGETIEKLGESVEELERLRKKLSESEDTVKSLKVECDHFKKQLAAKSNKNLEEERDRLKIVIAQLEAELQAANEMVQVCVTDGSTERATEAAAQALRKEIDMLRNQLKSARWNLDEEKAERENAELEINRLRDDLAALVSQSDQENDPTQLKHLTTKAIEKVQMKERAEIEELKRSLLRALDDLEISRSAEKKIHEELAKATIRLKVYEQNLVDAKSEISFLAGVMEDMRQTEESKRASLEFRVDSLENQNNVVRKYHAADVESARNELSQITMEKDRLVHQLRESEKTNASLLLASASNDGLESAIDQIDLKSECAKLRLENTHLLAMAADDKIKGERRLREMVAAQTASSEADIILEQGLRMKAECRIEELTAELETFRQERNESLSDTLSRNSAEFVAMGKDLESAKARLESLEMENADLRSRMEAMATKYKAKIDSLATELQKVQAKASRSEREGRRDLAVQAEIARIREESNLPAATSIHISAGDAMLGALDDGDTSFISSAEAFDQIQQQKKAIQEERKLYQEILAEQDEVFALLAQRDLQLACLKEALVEAVGDEAVDKATKKAEDQAMSKYGNAIRVADGP